jgi:hypothetical protein
MLIVPHISVFASCILLPQARFRNRPIMELQIAAAEQQKITELRLAKLMSVNSQSSSMHFSPSFRHTSLHLEMPNYEQRFLTIRHFSIQI